MIAVRVTIIGCGYVGLTTSAALAHTGHHVHCIDRDGERIRALQEGIVPIHETGLAELFAGLGGRLSFGCWDSFDRYTEVVIIAVGTPRKVNGDADTSHVEAVAAELGRRITSGNIPLIVNKSTVPIGSSRRVETVIRQQGDIGQGRAVMVASCPEFLREGAALYDTFYPDRIIVGSTHGDAISILREMYAPILEQTFRPPEFLPRPDCYTLPAFITTTPTSAELIKYAANAFLAMKISYINEIAGLAERVGADIKEVALGMGLDKRIGTRYMNAGAGWGGSCFGKDIQALIHAGDQYDCKMLMCRAAVQVNMQQREEIIRKLQSSLKVIRGSTVAILGLAFKPGTDDLRDAPAVTIAGRLIDMGAHVRAYDPVASENCRKNHPDLNIEYVSSPYDLAAGADALVLATEWNEFVHLPYARLGERMSRRVIIDGRNVLDSRRLEEAGFLYIGVGR